MSATGDFAELAERYCSLIEQAARAERLRFLTRVEEILKRLHAAASALPEVEPAAERSRDPEPMSSAEWESRFGELRQLIGTEAKGSIADDLVEVYRALGSGLRVLRSGAPPEDVIGRWRWDFDRRWAAPAERALFAIRQLIGPPM